MASEFTRRLERVERLRVARAKESHDKRVRALDMTSQMLNAGIRISFARVAREARVSTWLVYNVPEVRSAISAAVEAQIREGIAPTAPHPRRDQSNDSLRTDLALARDEIKSLREEVAKVRTRLQLRLGTEAEHASNDELIDRIRELETLNAALRSDLDDRENRILTLVEACDQLEADVEGKTEALRRMMFAANRDS